MSNDRHPSRGSLDDDHKIIDFSERRRLRARRQLVEALRNSLHIPSLVVFLVAASALASLLTGMLIGLHWRAAAAVTLLVSGAVFLLACRWLDDRQEDRS